MIYPLKACSISSIVSASIDNNGQKHARVALNLKFDVIIEKADDGFISVETHIGSDHGNNIGIIVGHCDGTVQNCYVCGAALNMNNGDSVTGSRSGTYKKLEYGSNTGLIGLIGNTVFNAISGDGIGRGTSTGVLDFTTIYNQIINNESFKNQSVYQDGVNNGSPNATTYKPIQTSKYLEYLRYATVDAKTQYVTVNNNSISFKGNEVISNSDLGVFTVATINGSEATGGTAHFEMGVGAINFENNLSVSYTDNESVAHNDYFVYFTTGEYDKSLGSYTDYQKSLTDIRSNSMLGGYYLPEKNQISKELMANREHKQNYIFRFKLEPKYRKDNGFYFSDIDEKSDGGAFIYNYLLHKLVDENGDPFNKKRPELGVRLQDYLPSEISKFEGSYTTQDLSNKGSVESTELYYCSKCDKNIMKSKTNNGYCLTHPDTAVEPFLESEEWYYCSTCDETYLKDELYNSEPGEETCPHHHSVTRQKSKYITNAINFEIKTKYANVTVVAAPTEQGKPAALGVYKINNSDISNSDVWSIKYNEPDYAFFMPSEDRLAYFDYDVDQTNKVGRVGVHDSSGNFTIASTNEITKKKTSAIIANEKDGNKNEYAAGWVDADSDGKFDAGEKKPRLFAHTFKLPKGRYCLGSATGVEADGDIIAGSQTNAKIYYVCAQGQTAGQLGFDSNIFGNDTIEGVDFVKVPRFGLEYPYTENITLDNIATYTGTGTALGNQRLYVSLTNSSRSSFAAVASANISFSYSYVDDERKYKFFVATTNINGITHVSVTNYNHSYKESIAKELTVSLFGAESNGELIAY